MFGSERAKAKERHQERKGLVLLKGLGTANLKKEDMLLESEDFIDKERQRFVRLDN